MRHKNDKKRPVPLFARQWPLEQPGWPDTTLVISHSKRMAVNATANRALVPEALKLLEVIHIDLGCQTTNKCSQTFFPVDGASIDIVLAVCCQAPAHSTRDKQ